MINEKLITALLAILLALGGWNLSQTFSLSNQMILVKFYKILWMKMRFW